MHKADRTNGQNSNRRSPTLPAANVDGATAERITGKRRQSPSDTTDTLPSGLDGDRHRASQKQAADAEILNEAIFPALMANALKLDKFVDAPGYRVFLVRLLSDLGNPADPLERLMVQQVALAHFRIAQLHGDAANAKSPDAAKIYTTLASRLLGEMRRSILSIKVNRTSVPDTHRTANLKLFKAAQ